MASAAFPSITAATAVVLAVLQMVLMLYTARGRGRYRTGLGDGGSDPLLRRIRMHGNLAENAPLLLILLLLTEMTGQWTHLLPFFAIGFVVVRLAHAIGLSMSAGVTLFRFVGVMGTLICDLGLAGLLAYTLANDTAWLPLKLF